MANKRLRALYDSKGMCLDCGSRPQSDGYKYCQVCRDYSSKRSKEKYKRKMEAIVKYMGGKCKRCGFSFPSYVYDFHHRNPDTKLFNISGNVVVSKDLDILLNELDKCDMLCANCHRIVEHGNNL